MEVDTVTVLDTLNLISRDKGSPIHNYKKTGTRKVHPKKSGVATLGAMSTPDSAPSPEVAGVLSSLLGFKPDQWPLHAP